MEKQMVTSKKVNVSINPETMKSLTEMRLRISQDLGFTPSYSQVIQMMLKINDVAEAKQTDNHVEMLTKGDVNE
jgi:hypothetical protein